MSDRDENFWDSTTEWPFSADKLEAALAPVERPTAAHGSSKKKSRGARGQRELSRDSGGMTGRWRSKDPEASE